MSDLQDILDNQTYINGIDAQKEYNDLLEWKRAIEDACIVNWVSITTPTETIQALINCVVQEALDPKISKSAQDLIEIGRKQKW